jgi:hypothetical protein
MLKRRFMHIIAIVAALFCVVGCATNDDGATPSQSSGYGTLYFGEESLPISFVRVTDSDDWITVLVSPLTNPLKLTTNAVFGLPKSYLGKEVDVMYKYCRDDYVVIYEDPVCYYAPFRPLQSGKMKMSLSNAGVSVEVDVVLFDGTPLRYFADNLPLQ